MNILYELPTGYGKTKKGIDLMDSSCSNLIVVSRLVHIKNWNDEFIKWGFDSNKITFTTYTSLHKYTKSFYDTIIFDECHHLSKRCLEIVPNLHYNNAVLLSATVKRDMHIELNTVFSPLTTEKVLFRKAVEEKKLPDPEVWLIPMNLDNKAAVYSFTVGKGSPINCTYQERFKHVGKKKTVSCTQMQYYTQMCDTIEWYKKMSFGQVRYKNMWLHKCKVRLDWLALEKTNVVKAVLNKMKKYRTLTFCANIEQTELLGKHCINSNQSTEDNQDALEQFNSKKINHITSCNMLNEGMNLVDCKVGIYANLSSSELIIKQRLGRILRHRKPLIIIPFWKNTREEEVVTKMLQDYNPTLVKTKNITEL